MEIDCGGFFNASIWFLATHIAYTYENPVRGGHCVEWNLSSLHGINQVSECHIHFVHHI